MTTTSLLKLNSDREFPSYSALEEDNITLSTLYVVY